LNFLEDTAHHLSVLLLYAFRQQVAGWVKTPISTEVDLRAGHIVLDGFPALHERDHSTPPF